MESLGQAARRLVERLERAAKAKEKIAGGFSVMVEDSAHGVNCHGGRPDRPPHRDDSMGEDRAEALPVRNGIDDSATSRALGREADRVPRPSASRPSGAQVSANDNRPAGGAGVGGDAAGRSRAREEDCAEGVHAATFSAASIKKAGKERSCI